MRRRVIRRRSGRSRTTGKGTPSITHSKPLWLKSKRGIGYDWTWDEIDAFLSKGKILRKYSGKAHSVYLAVVPRYGYVIAVKREEGIDTVQVFGDNKKRALKTFTEEKRHGEIMYEEWIKSD